MALRRIGPNVVATSRYPYHRTPASAEPREAAGWKGLLPRRAAIEREFCRLKQDWTLSALRVRGIDRRKLPADLTSVAKRITLGRARECREFSVRMRRTRGV